MNGKLLIAIEGITGVGKSTLQSVLSRRYRATTLVQQFEANPFLANSFADLKRNALEREMVFLFMAYHQLKAVDSSGLTISDFFFDKLKAFAYISLTHDQLQKCYLPCFTYLRRSLNQPDLIIRLLGSSSFALTNIRRRNRKGEEFLTEDYLAKLDHAFALIFDEYREEDKILAVNSEEIDLLDEGFEGSFTSQLELRLPSLASYRCS